MKRIRGFHICFVIVLMVLFNCLSFRVCAQGNKESNDKIIAEIMERWIENNETSVDFTDLRDQLEFYINNKIDLNSAGKEDLQRLGFIDDIAMNDIIEHRKKYGEYLSVYELQTIESIDDRTLYYLSYFVKTDDHMFGDKTPFLKMFAKGKNEVIALHENVFQDKVGYDKSRGDQGKEYYAGSPYRYVLRYRFNYSSKLSFGYTGEKDMGEQFFNGVQKYGFDFNSFHFVLRNQGNFKTIAIGDYQANFGQGLTFGSGLSPRKSAFVLNARRNFEAIRPYRSLNENEFLRGAAVTYKYRSAEITGIFSYKYISTNYRASDTIPSSEEVFSSIQLTGLHRTASEIQNRSNILQGIYGGHIKWRGDNYDVGISAINTFYDKSFLPGSKPYQLYNFSGTQLSNFGIDYNFYLGNANVFGEISNSSNGAFAGIAGLIVPVHQQIDILFMYRNYAKNYQTTFNNPFAENSDGRNEEGFYSGVSFKLNQQWIFNTYFDYYRSPWLRYMVDAPSKGNDFLSELQYNPSKTTQYYIRYRREIKSRNETGVAGPVDYLTDVSKEIVRLHVQYKVSPTVALKSRAEFSQYYDHVNGYRNGSLIYQDVIYTTAFKELSFIGRIAVFTVEDYNARLYATESDVLYQYSIPQYQNSGVRYYLLIHYSLSKKWDLWIKYSQTNYNNVKTISSGLEQINGNTVSDMSVQLRWSF